jgi:endonuclease/exonuclease/phosphatase (EEP) superfamily protein YafD
VTASVWLLAVPPALSAVGVLVRPLYDPLRPSLPAWLADIAATLSPQALLPGAACVLLAIAARRFVAGLLALASLLVLLVVVLETERAPRSQANGEAEGPIVTVLAMNVWSSSDRGAEQLRLMLESGADLIMLNEVSADLLAELRTDPRARAAYPYFRLPDRAGRGYRFVLSRHPIARGGDAFGFIWPEVEQALGYHGQRVLRVELPQGPFVFAGVQFRSPRSPERWAAGNQQAADTARGLSMIAERTRLPIVVAGDLNATPLGARSLRAARSAGLLRVKPALRLGGTFPALLPVPMQAAIDGGLVSPGVRVVAYRTLAIPGSDHRAALMTLELPGQAAVSSSSP